MLLDMLLKNSQADGPQEDDTISDEQNESSEEEEEESKKSNVSHSRFSSNIGDLEDELELMMGDGIRKDIESEQLEVKELHQDKRQLLQKKKGAEAALNIDFGGEIASIQDLQASPQKKNCESGARLDERESMVVMGSKNLEKVV